MKIHVSKGNSKLGTIPNISLPPIETCPEGALCIEKCYAKKAWRQYPATRKAWSENLELYQKGPNEYFHQLRKWLLKHKPEFFRFHVAGDIPDEVYWKWLTGICMDLDETKFLVFTKRFELDFTLAPANLSVVLSMWPGHTEPVGFAATLPKAWCQDGTETRVPVDALPCPGNCSLCGACWGLAQRSLGVVFNLH